jgi:hypothetical protein
VVVSGEIVGEHGTAANRLELIYYVFDALRSRSAAFESFAGIRERRSCHGAMR